MGDIFSVFLHASAMREMYRIVTPFGAEYLPGSTTVWVLAAPRVAIARPLADVPRNSLIVRFAEYSPDSLDRLDFHLSSPDSGSELYRKAKGIVFNLGMSNPAKKKRIGYSSSDVLESFRPRLSELLIRGLAGTADESLEAAGVMPGEELEARLSYASRRDFFKQQYGAMATALEKIVAEAEARQGTPHADRSTILGYLKGEIKTPKQGRWALLRLFAGLNDEFQRMHESRNETSFTSQEGFYWAVRMFDLMRIFLRKRQIFVNGRHEGQEALQPRNGNWDYIPAGKAFADFMRGQVEPIDKFYDAVRVLDISQIHESLSAYNAELRKQVSADSSKRKGIYVPGKSPDAPEPQLTVKTPKELWVDFFSLYNICNMHFLLYLGQIGKKLYVDRFGIGKSPVPSVVTHLVPPATPLLKADSYGDTGEQDFQEERQMGRLEQSLIDGVNEGVIDSALQLPQGTFLRLFGVMRQMAAQVPAEMAVNSFLTSRIEELESYIASKKTLTHEERGRVLQAVNLNGIVTNREDRGALATLKEKRTRVMKNYSLKYGGDVLRNFRGIDLTQHQPQLSLINPGRNHNHYDPSADMFTSMLSVYNLTALGKHAYNATPANLMSPLPEIARVLVVAREPTILPALPGHKSI